MKRTLSLCGLLLASCNGVADTYVKADRLTYEAIAPEYRAYVLADELLDEDAKARRLLSLDTWNLRIKASEGDK